MQTPTQAVENPTKLLNQAMIGLGIHSSNIRTMSSLPNPLQKELERICKKIDN